MSSGYEGVRQRHVARFRELLPEYVANIGWTAQQLRRAQDEGLRDLVATAIKRSPWHRERLGDLDVAGLRAADLEGLPVMTKRDLMENFDDIVTDGRIDRATCERHLGAAANAYLLDEFHVVASGGSSGQRGVFVYGWDAWAICYCSIVRFPIRDRASDPALASVAQVIATVAAASASHISAAIGATFSAPNLPRHSFPVSEPIDRIVAGLNDLQPTTLMGYSSFLPRLAAEVRAGRLRIAPRRIVAISEPLLPEARADLETTWGAAVASGYGMSEGLFAGSCGHGLHLPDDLCLLEPIGPNGTPIPRGVTSDRVYVTNLYNKALPLIRYDVTDQITVLDGPCPCGSSFRRIADPLGRLDDTFTYANGVAIHPHVFRSALGHEDLIEYQVRQTPTGADIAVVNSAPVDTTALARQIEDTLRALGLTDPTVSITLTETLERQPTGKLRRFVPINAPHQDRGAT
jgi:phenylacetate-coenzyme A ligase PaaK-like adenylate-forming protein